MEWMILPLRRYAQFRGRSQRKEFWMFFLFLTLVNLALNLFGTLFNLGKRTDDFVMSEPRALGYYAALGSSWVGGVFWLAMVLPYVAVAVRRVHDTNRSGWWVLAVLVLYIGGFVLLGIGLAITNTPALIAGGAVWCIGAVGAIVLLVWFCLPGTPGPNRFGDDPMANIPADLARAFE